jgi:hypothetical protein
MLRSHAPLSATWRIRLERLDRRVTTVLAAAAVPVLRVALGVVSLWFGALKLFPGLSPAQDLAGRTVEQLTFGLGPPAAAPSVGMSTASWTSTSTPSRATEGSP